MDGFAFTTKFNLICEDFKTPNPPLTFTIYAKLRAEQGRGKMFEYNYDHGYPIVFEVTTLTKRLMGGLYNAIIPYYEFVLPAGHPWDGFKLPITVKVSDSLGRSTYYFGDGLMPKVESAHQLLTNKKNNKCKINSSFVMLLHG